MVQALTSIDIHFLVREFQELLGAKVENIYQKAPKSFLFVLHLPNIGRKNLRLELPGMFYLSGSKGSVPEEPGQFCMFLRKHLKGSRIREISQLGFERVIRLDLETKAAQYVMFVELFSLGNLVLCGPELVIRSALVQKKWKDRVIRGNVRYEFPMRDLDFLKIDADSFQKALRGSDKESLVKSLAIDFGLGGVYAEELCSIAGVEKDRPLKALSDQDIGSLFSAAGSLRDRDPCACSDGAAVFPFRLRTRQCIKEFPSFSDGLDCVLTPLTDSGQQDPKLQKRIKEEARLNKILREQDESIKTLEAEVEECQKKGTLIYENYEKLDRMLQELQDLRKKNSWKEFRQLLKKSGIIRGADEKENSVVVEI